MKTCTLTRIVAFTAAHHYAVRGWSDEQNETAFGRSARPHEHEYRCAVTVRGTPDKVTGMIVDLGLLDAVLREEIVERFDGRDLNADPAFSGTTCLPTGEELCINLWHRLAQRFQGLCTLEAVRVQENPMLYAEYRGE